MKKNDLSEKIMQQIAKQEKKDILTSIFVVWPGIMVLLIITLVSTNKTIGSLSSYGFFELFIELDLQNRSIIPQLSKVGDLLLSEFREGYLAVSTSSTAAVVFLSRKSKLHNLGTRIKDINLYLPDNKVFAIKIDSRYMSYLESSLKQINNSLVLLVERCQISFMTGLRRVRE